MQVSRVLGVCLVLWLCALVASDPIWRSEAASGKRCLCRYVVKDGFVYDEMKSLGFFASQCACNSQVDGVLCHIYKKKRNGMWKLQSSPYVHARRSPNPCTTYLTNRPLVDYEDGFASDDYSNKDDYKTINYFWWGALTSTSKPEYLNNALLAVNKIAVMLKGKGFKIRYYHQPTATALNRGLNDDIEQVTIGHDGTFETPGDLLANTDLAGVSDSINNIIGTYEYYGAKTYAGVKDLLILCILYANGGYFFDTNVRPDDDDGDVLAQALTEFGEERGIPAYPHLYPMDQVLEQPNEMCLYLVEDDSGKIAPEEPILNFPKMEFNGAFVPKGHPAIRSAILQYILNAKSNGLNTGGKASKDKTDKSWTAGDAAFKRDVGTFIRWSVCSGLLKYAQATPVTLSDFLFEIEKHTGGLRFVPLKLSKFYGNTWRKTEDLEANLESLEKSLVVLNRDG